MPFSPPRSQKTDASIVNSDHLSLILSGEQIGKVTPSKTTMEPRIRWFVDVCPFPTGLFQVPAVSFQGI